MQVMYFFAQQHPRVAVRIQVRSVHKSLKSHKNMLLEVVTSTSSGGHRNVCVKDIYISSDDVLHETQALFCLLTVSNKFRQDKSVGVPCANETTSVLSGCRSCPTCRHTITRVHAEDKYTYPTHCGMYIDLSCAQT